MHGRGEERTRTEWKRLAKEAPDIGRALQSAGGVGVPSTC